jgi:hypothetical protein
MAQPRRHGSKAVPAELALFRRMRSVRDSNIFTVGTAAHLALEEAWDRLLRSGVVRERNIERVCDAIVVKLDAHLAATKARRASEVLRACALEACGAREVHAAQFKKCAACASVVYCCKAHQEAHWPAHKPACNTARKAAAEGGAGPSSDA